MSALVNIPVSVPGDSIQARAVLRALLGDPQFRDVGIATAAIALLVDEGLEDPEDEPVIERLLDSLVSSSAAEWPVPLILTPRADKLEVAEYHIPTAHTLGTTGGTAEPSLSLLLRERVRSLADWYIGNGDAPRRVTKSDFRDWIVDHIRRLLKLEVHSHRPTEAAYVAISRLSVLLESRTSKPITTDGEREFEALCLLRTHAHALHSQWPSSTLLRDILGPMVDALSKLDESWTTFVSNGANKELLSEIEHAFPRRCGVGFLNRLATRMKVLVIDDDLANPKEAAPLLASLSKTPLGGSDARLGDFVEFFGLPVRADDRSNLEHFIRSEAALEMLESDGNRATAALPPAAFDLFLVDLSFGEKPGEESFGHEIIWRLKRVCPGTPVLVHSAFSQRSHVIRAVQHGADWYCRKGDASRLVDHLASYVMAPRWTLSTSEADKVILPPSKELGATEHINRKKSLYTRLLREVPGDRLRITGLRGEGGAETARVEMELGSDLSRVSPTIVKIGRPDAVRMEQERYARFISPYLGNHVGRVDHRVVQAGALHAAIGYTHAGHGGGRSVGTGSRVVSYKDYLHRALRGGGSGTRPDPGLLVRPLEMLFGEILPRVHDIQPEWDSTLPYPNPFFDEHDDPASSFLLRLPAECQLEIVDFREPQTGKSWSDARGVNKSESIKLPDALIVRVELASDGRAFERIVLLQQVKCNGTTYYRRFDAIPRPGDKVISSSRLRRLGRIAVEGKILNGKSALWEALSPKPKKVGGSDLAAAFESFVATLRATRGRVGIIHGDLHCENVLLDANWSPNGGLNVEKAPWLIDFGRTRRDEIIHDFVVAEQCVVKEFLYEDLFTGVRRNQRTTEFLESWLLSPWNRPACLTQDPTGRLEVIFHILSRIRSAASQAGVAGAFGDDKRYLSGLGLYLLWALKWNASQKPPDRHLARVCAEAVKIIQEYVRKA